MVIYPVYLLMAMNLLMIVFRFPDDIYGMHIMGYKWIIIKFKGFSHWIQHTVRIRRIVPILCSEYNNDIQYDREIK